MAGPPKSGTPSRVINIMTNPPPGTKRDSSFISDCFFGSTTCQLRLDGSDLASKPESHVLMTTEATRPGYTRWMRFRNGVKLSNRCHEPGLCRDRKSTMNNSGSGSLERSSGLRAPPSTRISRPTNSLEAFPCASLHFAARAGRPSTAWKNRTQSSGGSTRIGMNLLVVPPVRNSTSGPSASTGSPRNVFPLGSFHSGTGASAATARPSTSNTNEVIRTKREGKSMGPKGSG